jgi:hypothetical protein
MIAGRHADLIRNNRGAENRTQNLDATAPISTFIALTNPDAIALSDSAVGQTLHDAGGFEQCSTVGGR